MRGGLWYFGPGYGLDFTDGPVKTDFSSQMDTYESSSVVADKQGNLLFYSNGGGRENGEETGFIWNRLHEPMEGGELGGTLGGGNSSAQGCLSIRKPGSEFDYYLFTVDEFETMLQYDNSFPNGKGLSYFEIDMEANNGLGRVTVSNQKLLEPCFEYISGTQHANCRDYWVITTTSHYFLTENPDTPDSIYIYEVNDTGIQSPLRYPLPMGQEGIPDEYGLIKIAPDGSRFRIGNFLYDFDKATGAIDSITNLGESYGIAWDEQVAFSANSQYLYRFRPERLDSISNIRVLQYDMSAPDPPATTEFVGEQNYFGIVVFGYPQLAPDGQIYLPIQQNSFSAPTIVAAIEQPQLPGIAAQFNPASFVITKGENDERFLSFGNFTDHIFRYDPSISFDLGPDVTLACDSSLSQTLYAPEGSDCYVWSDGSIGDSLVITEAGDYWLEVFEGCEMGIDSVKVSWDSELPTLDLGPDTTLCEGEELMLAPLIDEVDYFWQDGSDYPFFIVDTSGTYSLEIRRGACFQKDSIQIDYLPIPHVQLPNDTTLCNSIAFFMDAKSNLEGITYEWQNGSERSFFVANESGTYSVSLTNGCGTFSDTVDIVFSNCLEPVCSVFVPNAFSPNDDGANDTFRAYSNCPIDNFHLQIWDRWGGLMFESFDINDTWDGKFDGRNKTQAVFVWIIRYDAVKNNQLIQEVKVGDLTLLR